MFYLPAVFEKCLLSEGVKTTKATLQFGFLGDGALEASPSKKILAI